MFTMTLNLFFIRGKISDKNFSMPGFSSPIQFNIPAGVSVMRTPLFPARGFKVVHLTITPPSFFKSTKSENSSPKPKVPLAAKIGEDIFIPQISVFKSSLIIFSP